MKDSNEHKKKIKLIQTRNKEKKYERKKRQTNTAKQNEKNLQKILKLCINEYGNGLNKD